MPERLSRTRIGRVWSDVEERNERKRSLTQTRVGNGQRICLEYGLGHPENVQIQGARSPAVAAGPTVPGFDRQQGIQQSQRLELGPEPDGGVQIARLRGSDGLGFVERRHRVKLAEVCNFTHGPTQYLAPVAQVGTEADDAIGRGPRHWRDGRNDTIESIMELTGGELFVVVFITLAVVSAAWWPRLGELVMLAVSGARTKRGEADSVGSDRTEGE